MADERASDSLTAGDRRWLGSEFGATRRLIQTSTADLHRRIDDHIAAGHPDGGPSWRRRWKVVGIPVALLTGLATVAGGLLSGFLAGGGGAAAR